jgi:rhamnose utilization protein RhaD (predicted bifunctional aldolase and dehydrogenase)
MLAARMPGEENKRPSVETVLHAIFPYKLVVHVHPAMVNGLTCSNDGKNACNTLFGELVIWVESALPGPDLARKCISVLSKREKNSGSFPQILLLQNHGVFIAADTAEEIDNLMAFVMDKIRSSIKEFPDFTDTVTAVFPGNADSERQSDKKYDVSAVSSTASELRNLYSSEGKSVCVFCINKEIAKYVSGVEAFGSLSRAFTPDQVVHSHGEYLFVESNASMSAAFFDYVAKTGVKPKIVAVRGIGFFALGNNAKEASRASQSFLDAVKIAIYAKSFGGTNPLPRKLADELVNIYGTSR